MSNKKKLFYRSKRGELFPCHESDGLELCCERYNRKLHDCYDFIERATNNPMPPIQRKLNGEYYTSPFYKEFFGCWCGTKSKTLKKEKIGG